MHSLCILFIKVKKNYSHWLFIIIYFSCNFCFVKYVGFTGIGNFLKYLLSMHIWKHVSLNLELQFLRGNWFMHIQFQFTLEQYCILLHSFKLYNGARRTVMIIIIVTINKLDSTSMKRIVYFYEDRFPCTTLLTTCYLCGSINIFCWF